MTCRLKGLLLGCGAVALAIVASGTAMAQYYRGDGYERRYERPGYDDRRGYDRGYERGNGRGGWDRDDRYGRGFYGRGRDNPVNRMTIEEQKQALKNHREAQKKAIKRGYLMP